MDSADPREWAQLWPLGLFQGITTNPTLLKRAGQACSIDGLRSLASEARSLGCRELHLQAWGSSVEDLLVCSRALLALGQGEIVVKLPLTDAGLLAARSLVEEGAPVTLTACYGASQVLAAAALDCTYVAPYLGRISDGGADGCAELVRMQKALAGVKSRTRLLVASLRSADEILQLAAAGIDTYTLPPALVGSLWRHPATEKAAAQFEADAL